jgi:hypothetical protein
MSTTDDLEQKPCPRCCTPTMTIKTEPKIPELWAQQRENHEKQGQPLDHYYPSWRSECGPKNGN